MARDPRTVEVRPICHPKGCRSYVVVDPATREACVVDPLLDRVAETQRLLGDAGAHLRWIVDTHTHGDHLSGAAALKARTGADVVMHPEAPGEVATVRPSDGEVLPLGHEVLRVLHAPGNAPDGLVLQAPGALFTGDTLLIGTVGLRDDPRADARAWFDTLHRIFGEGPEETVIHPGHDDMGRTMSSLRQERAGNGWLRLDDFEAFRHRYEAEDRPVGPDAGAFRSSNEKGLLRVPRELSAATGFQDPAHVTEEALKERVRRTTGEPPPPRRLPGTLPPLLALLGTVIVAATLLGWWLHELFHALSALAGIALLGLALPSGRSRRTSGDGEPGLYYEGPGRRTLGE